MRHIATQHIAKQYPVSLYECEPEAIIHDEVQYQHGRWYVVCGGEGHYFLDMNEATQAFDTLVKHQFEAGKQ